MEETALPLEKPHGISTAHFLERFELLYDAGHIVRQFEAHPMMSSFAFASVLSHNPMIPKKQIGVRRFTLTAAIGCCVAFSTLGETRADVFRFRDGRVISGALSQKYSTDEFVVIQIDSGALVKVSRKELARNGHDAPNDFENEYLAKIRSLKETAEAHYQLAGWCSSKGLVDLADAHYRRALDIDPNHSDARVAADYDKDENGRWVKKEVVMGQKRGMVRIGRKWRFPESVVLEQQNTAEEKLINPLKKEINSWNSRASNTRDSSQNREKAMQKLRQIQDPKAAPIIAELLLKTRRPSPPGVRLIHVALLARFKGPVAAGALARASIYDPELAVRTACLDALRQFGREIAIPMYIGGLSSDKNHIINNSAIGLSQFAPPQAVLPLIGALNTEHIVETGANGNSMNISGPSGLSFGGNAKTVKQPFQNDSVRNALSDITKQDYGFNENEWMAWYARLYGSPARDLRRDP